MRHHFLVPRLVLNEASLPHDLLGDQRLARAGDWLRRRDPVCGMLLGEHVVMVMLRNVRYGFCSDQ